LREQGRTIAGKPILHEAPPPPSAEAAAADAARVDTPAAADVQPKRRVDFSPLFTRYCQARSAIGEDVTRLKYEKFEELVLKQAEEIKRRTGCKRLVFEVQTQEGKVRLIGRPAPAKG